MMTCNICNMTAARRGDKRAALNTKNLFWHLKNLSSRWRHGQKYYTEGNWMIALDNQLISVVEDQGFLLPWIPMAYLPMISALHYIDPTFELQHAGMCKFHGSHTAEHVKQNIEVMLNACEMDKQWVNVILCDNVRNMKKAMMIWRYQAWAASCTHFHTSAGCTRGSAVTTQHHKLTCWSKEGGRPMLQ